MSHYIWFNSNPLLDYLTDNWEQIRDEYIQWISWHRNQYGTKLKANIISSQTQNLPLYEGTFESVSLFLRDSLLIYTEARLMGWENFGKKEGAKYIYREEWLKQMPTLHKWVVEHFDILGSIQINTCKPGSLLRHHFGNDPNYLRFHLTLEEAAGCEFNIENECHTWKNGELFGFDDAIVYHGTKHTGTQDRTILIIDILKSEVKQYAKEWSIVDGMTKKDRFPKAIVGWYPKR